MQRHQDAAAEVGAWVNWLKGQGTGQIVLLGHSRGGNQVARYAVSAQAEPAIRAVYLLAPQTWAAGRDSADYKTRFKQPLAPRLAEAEAAVAVGDGDKLLGPMPFICCDESKASAAAVVAYYGGDAEMDTPAVIPGIAVPVTVFAASEDTAVPGLIEADTPLADGDKVRLRVIDGADLFFRDLHLEDVTDQIAADLGAAE